MIVRGEFPIHDIGDIGVPLPEGDYTTIAGLIMDRLGRAPRRGERISESGWQIEVVEVTGHSIRRVRLVPPAAAPRSSP